MKFLTVAVEYIPDISKSLNYLGFQIYVSPLLQVFFLHQDANWRLCTLEGRCQWKNCFYFRISHPSPGTPKYSNSVDKANLSWFSNSFFAVTTGLAYSTETSTRSFEIAQEHSLDSFSTVTTDWIFSSLSEHNLSLWKKNIRLKSFLFDLGIKVFLVQAHSSVSDIDLSRNSENCFSLSADLVFARMFRSRAFHLQKRTVRTHFLPQLLIFHQDFSKKCCSYWEV